MKRRPFLAGSGALLCGSAVMAKAISPTHQVTLPQAHRGTLEIDTLLLDSYQKLPENVRQFYFDARKVFESGIDKTFTDPEIIAAAKRHGIALMGGPLLGQVTEQSVVLWMRPASEQAISVICGDQQVTASEVPAGQVLRLELEGLSANTTYQYAVRVAEQTVAEGEFVTAPKPSSDETFRITFGSCCHKIGVHNPNLYQTIVSRRPHAMMLLGDIAVDDRNNEVNMHRCDYQLRDVSKAFSHLAANVPLYASWDDHDYFDNDLSGIPRRYNHQDRQRVRQVWLENWNNPSGQPGQEGIYFSSRVGPVEIIMLDTRSCRDGGRRKQAGSYLGDDQMKWLKETLQRSTAPFKVVSSGTMWSDYVSNGKDSWGTWDQESRDEVFDWIEDEKIGGVLLVSGDRHGARGFRLPRPSGFEFYEFEPATLGGVSGPGGIVKNCDQQLFGYSGKGSDGQPFVAFGEFTFQMGKQPQVTFRLISQHAQVLEEIELPLETLTP